jgi:predicted ester cyclase
MTKEQENKAIAARWLKGFWGHAPNPKIVDDLAANDISLQFSLQIPCRGPAAAKTFLAGFREIFPDVEFHQAGDLIADGEYIYGRVQGSGTHAGPAFLDHLVGFFPAHSGRKMDLAGTITLRIRNGKIAEELTRVTWAADPLHLRKAAA